MLCLLREYGLETDNSGCMSLGKLRYLSALVFSSLCACVLSHFSRVRLFVDSMGCSSPGFSVRAILQARILEWVSKPSSRASS